MLVFAKMAQSRRIFQRRGIFFGFPTFWLGFLFGNLSDWHADSLPFFMTIIY